MSSLIWRGGEASGEVSDGKTSGGKAGGGEASSCAIGATQLLTSPKAPLS